MKEIKDKIIKFLKKVNYYHFFFIVLLIFMSTLFFMGSSIIFPDSVEYYRYLDIFNGVVPFSDWNVVRGFSFPLILWIFTKLFGFSHSGINIGIYLFYVFLIIFSYYILFSRVLKAEKNTIKKIKLYIIYIICIVLNPILFGYCHSVLTEFVAIPLTLLSCYLALIWSKDKSNIFCNKNNIKCLIIFSILFVFVWFLKQPYFSIVFFPLVLGFLISIIIHKDLKNALIKIANLLLCCIVLVCSIIVWKKVLIVNDVNYNNGQNSGSFINSSIIGSLSNFNIITDNDYETMVNDEYISIDDKEKLEKNKNNFWVIEVLNDNSEIVKKYIMFYENEEPNTLELISELLFLTANEPERVINSYIYNYLASIDIFISNRLPNNVYRPLKYYNYYYNHENESIGLSIFELEDNTKWISDEQKNNVSKFISINKLPKSVNNIVYKIKDLYFLIFKILYFILPYLFIKHVINFMKIKKKDNINENYIFGLILIGFVFFHSIFHAVTGLIIDRYIYISFPSYIIGILLLNTYSKEVNK